MSFEHHLPYLESQAFILPASLEASMYEGEGDGGRRRETDRWEREGQGKTGGRKDWVREVG